jgi:hypothetical protein
VQKAATSTSRHSQPGYIPNRLHVTLRAMTEQASPGRNVAKTTENADHP